MRGALTKRVLDMLGESSPRTSRRSTRASGTEFGAVLKEGLAEDHGNQDKLLPLLRFASTPARATEGNVSLADYVGRMQTGQDKIYYVVGESSPPRAAIRPSKACARATSRCCC
jgi:molecular chaperone HtpG